VRAFSVPHGDVPLSPLNKNGIAARQRHGSSGTQRHGRDGPTPSSPIISRHSISPRRPRLSISTGNKTPRKPFAFVLHTGLMRSEYWEPNCPPCKSGGRHTSASTAEKNRGALGLSFSSRKRFFPAGQKQLRLLRTCEAEGGWP